VGLDTRFARLDNGKITWCDLDVPEVIALRARFCAEDERHRTIARSVLDPGWMEAVPGGAPVLFIAEGLANYLEEQEIRTVVCAIARRFPSAEFVLEALGLVYVRLNGNPMYKWGVCADNTPATWDPGLQLIESWDLFSRHPERWAQFPWMAPLLPFGENIQAIFHLRVAP
jgi:O-methyltransferase involved in polyketide biosynthesis